MNRIDIVRQQRSVPLLNELLFSVLDAKPDDPLDFLINALERISSDVATARGRLVDIRRNRKQLNETLVVARKRHRPVCLTLLLHAGGDQRRCPLLRDMYDNDHRLRHDAATGGNDGTHRHGVMLPPLLASLQNGGDGVAPHVAKPAAPQPSVQSTSSEAPLAAATTADADSSAADASPEPCNDAAAPVVRENEALVSQESMLWSGAVEDALRTPMPSDALAALATHVRTAPSPDAFAGIEVLLVSAVRLVDQFPSTVNSSPSPCCQDTDRMGDNDGEADARRDSLVSIATTTTGTGEGTVLRALSLLLDVVREDAQRDALFPSLQALDDAVAFSTPPPQALSAAASSTAIDGVHPRTATTVQQHGHAHADRGHLGPLMLLLESVGDGATYPSLWALALALDAQSHHAGIETHNGPQRGEVGAQYAGAGAETARPSATAAIFEAAGRELPCLALLAAAATAARVEAAGAPPNTAMDGGASATAPSLWLSLLKVFADECPQRYPLTRQLLVAGAETMVDMTTAVVCPNKGATFDRLELLADIVDAGAGSSRLRLLCY